MEGSKKFEEAALRGITRHHVWTSRTSDLTVINLRDPYEVLGAPEAAAVAPPPAVVEVKRQAAPPSPPPAPRTTTGKQESLSALLSKLQLGRPAMEAVAAPKAPPQPAASPAVQTTTTAATAATAHLPTPSPMPPTLPSTAHTSAPAAAAAPPLPPPPPPPPAPVSLPVPSPSARVAEAHNPTFPDLRDSSPSGAGQFEFITGTNIPGQGVVKKAEVRNEVASMALFHDPLWGGSLLDAFPSPPPASRRSPKPPQRSSLSELYAPSTAAAAAVTAMPTTRTYVATPPAATHTPVASPPVPTMTTVTPLPTTMAPQQLSMMGGLMAGPAPQLPTPYPMYPMPLQYVAQPQFPGGLVYNPAGFFPFGAPTMMMPQPQQLPQGYQVAPSAMMRPGTNVKAMPFVPGSTM